MDTLTPAECRTARAALSWSQAVLAQRTGMTTWSVRIFEATGEGGQSKGVLRMREALLDGGVLIMRENGFSVVKFRCDAGAAADPAEGETRAV